jgi:hypothetical protein
MNTQLANEQLQKIVKLFSSQELPKVAAMKFIDAPEKPCSHWSLGNNVLMWLAGTTDARTFNQWNQVQRYVNKGSKAFYILAPSMIKKQVKDQQGQIELDDQGQAKTEVFLVGFHPIPVFRIEDTNGKELEKYRPKTIPPLFQVAQHWKVKIEYERLNSAYGAYSPEDNKIILATEEVKTFFHELSHKAHEIIDGKLQNGQRPDQEAIADLSACVLARLYGFNYDSETWHYLASYTEDKTPEAVGRLCFSVLSKVQKVIELILNADNQITTETALSLLDLKTTALQIRSRTLVTQRALEPSRKPTLERTIRGDKHGQGRT